MNSYHQQRRKAASHGKIKSVVAVNSTTTPATARDLRSYNSSRYHQLDKPLPPQHHTAPAPASATPTPPISEEEEEYQKSDEEGNADVVWENLQEIFEDIDARSEGLENKQQLKKPIMHLRRLLQMHSKIRTEEIELEEMLLGVSYEREWYLRKLQAVEAVIAAPESCLSRSSPSSSALSWLNDGAVQSLIKAISIILYEDNEDFSLVGSKLPVSYNM